MLAFEREEDTGKKQKKTNCSAPDRDRTPGSVDLRIVIRQRDTPTFAGKVRKDGGKKNCSFSVCYGLKSQKTVKVAENLDAVQSSARKYGV